MQQIAVTGRRQFLWILLAAFVLITLCSSGLWLYVKNADAETGVMETTQTELPKEDNAFITREKYDNYPPLEETADTDVWHSGIGLMTNEKERLPMLNEEYNKGRRPENAAPALPTETGFAITPLDPASFDGMTEYYFLPDTLLTDEQLLQLIAYNDEMGASFTAGTLTVRNSTRGDTGYPVNRMFSAGEKERLFNMNRRAYEIDFVPQELELTLPISGIAYIPLNQEMIDGSYPFAFFPFRELTDKELLQEVYRSNSDGYILLNPAEERDLNPAQDNLQLRALLEQISLMPLSASYRNSSYTRKESTGEILFSSQFESARINGIKTEYSAAIDYKSKQLLYVMLTIDDQSFPDAIDDADIIESKENMNDPKWAEIITKAVKSLATSDIEKLEADCPFYFGNACIPGARFLVTMQNGGCYSISIRYSDGAVMSVLYGPAGQDPWEWIMENPW